MSIAQCFEAYATNNRICRHLEYGYIVFIYTLDNQPDKIIKAACIKNAAA